MKSNFYIVSDSTIQKESKVCFKEVRYYYCTQCKQEINNYSYNANQDAICNQCKSDKLSTHKPINHAPNYLINKDTLCFQNGNVILPFKMALMARYTFKDIADILNIDCQEVCSQFNRMAKESGYKLFN